MVRLVFSTSKFVLEVIRRTSSNSLKLLNFFFKFIASVFDCSKSYLSWLIISFSILTSSL